MNQPQITTRDLLTRVQTEADRCPNDIASLLDEVTQALTTTQAPAPAHACNCPNIGACDGSCAPYVGKRDDPQDPMLAEAWEMAKRLEPAAAEMMRKLCKRLREDDRMLSQTIDEREERQQFIDDLLDALHGPDRHEWTSAYGFNDAMEDALERLAALEADSSSPAVKAELTEQERKDAARYQWLRLGDGKAPPEDIDWPLVIMHETREAIWEEEVDAAIDAAMCKSQPPVQGSGNG